MNLNDLKKIDFEKIINIVKNNFDKDAGLYTLILCLILFFGIKQFVYPSIATFGDNLTKVNQKQEELKKFQAQEKYMVSPESKKTKHNLAINVYKAPYPGMDTETASVELVQEIIKIIKEAGNNRIDKIDFTTEKLNDAAGNNSPDYSLLSLNLSLEGSFESVQNMLNEIYLMNYLVVIDKITSKLPENNDYNLIKTDLTLKLYIKLNDTPDTPQ